MGTNKKNVSRDTIDKDVVKEAIRELWDERASVYTNGSVRFANRITSIWGELINSFDDYFLENFLEDQPHLAQPALEARLAAASHARELIDKKVKDLEKRLTKRKKP